MTPRQGCSVPDCDREHGAKNFCDMHYQRWRRHGDPRIVLKAHLPTAPVENLEVRFSDGRLAHLTARPGLERSAEILLSRVKVNKGCWVWQGTHKNGYGECASVRATTGTARAHRAMYVCLIAPVPDHLVIDHLCRNTLCCNPEHLEPVTDRVNIRRGIGPAAVNARKVKCKRGHKFTPENTYWRPSGRQGRHCRTCIKLQTVKDEARKRRSS